VITAADGICFSLTCAAAAVNIMKIRIKSMKILNL
jgi:hypothetical protein